MSGQHTPRSTRSISVAGSPAQVLTPGHKVKALLAAFDSDSETENVLSVTDRIAKSRSETNISNVKSALVVTQEEDEDDDDDDDDTIVFAPRGRIAARMQGLENPESLQSKQRPETAYERVARRLREPSADATAVDAELTNASHSSGDDLPDAAPSRRRNTRRSESPLFLDNDSEEESGNLSNKDADEPKNARFLALIQRKRKEREEKERTELEKKAARAEKVKQFNSDIIASEESDEDPGSARKLTQQSRPTRKASKKALEEMHRETQRLSRNMQLAHQPQVKRKITVQDFVARMNARWQSGPTIQASNETKSSTSSSSAASLDSDGNKDGKTPPTSPIRANSEDRLHDQKPGISEKAAPTEPTATTAKAPKKFAVRLSREEISRRQHEEPDDELVIVTSPGKCRLLEAFDNVRSNNSLENQPMLKLRMLARLTSPTRQANSMSYAELNASLRIKARQQALQERQERIEELRAKGIVIETAEEREAMEAEIEDLVEKARQEGDEIARREKSAREKKTGVVSDDDDDDFMLSGSEDDEENDSDDEDHENQEELIASDMENEDSDEMAEDESDDRLGGLVETEADIDADSADEESGVAIQGSEQIDVTRVARRNRRLRVLDEDDEEEAEAEAENGQATMLLEIKTPARPIPLSDNSAQRPHFPDMPGTSSFTMGLSQAFAGTIAENQSDAGDDPLNEAIPSLPDPGSPHFRDLTINSQVLVKDSQEQRSDMANLFSGRTQSLARVSESPDPRWSQQSQIPEPTQDIGFVYTPFDQSKRFVDLPNSTIDTVILPDIESPVRRKSRLQRGRPAQLSDDEDADFEMKASAFDVMKKATERKAKSAALFNKLNSKARAHVDEAAEESEDEYAGLGGASDDEDGDEDELDKEMINDDSGEVVDEKELAALNANHERAMDEKEVSKLLKDITTGALRRRHGAHDDLDLDDSDDERIARRKAKQREFAKMRKALLADEKISEIASNPKKAAFFKALEDRDDVEMDFEFENAAESNEVSSQDTQREAQPAAIDSDNASNKRKRPLKPAAEDVYNRPAPHLRRTAATVSRKPSTLAEIRETLSFLTETPEYDSFREDVASIEEEIVYSTDLNNTEQENNAELHKGTTTEGFSIPPNPRRTRGPVVDRLALLRAASSNSASATNKAAFMTESTSWDSLQRIGFRPPALLNRSATSSWSTSSSSSSFSTNATKSTSGAKPVVTSLKASVNYYTAARERERERELRSKDRKKGTSAGKMKHIKEKEMGSGLRALRQGEFTD